MSNEIDKSSSKRNKNVHEISKTKKNNLIKFSSTEFLINKIKIGDKTA